MLTARSIVLASPLTTLVCTIWTFSMYSQTKLVFGWALSTLAPWISLALKNLSSKVITEGVITPGKSLVCFLWSVPKYNVSFLVWLFYNIEDLLQEGMTTTHVRLMVQRRHTTKLSATLTKSVFPITSVATEASHLEKGAWFPNLFEPQCSHNNRTAPWLVWKWTEIHWFTGLYSHHLKRSAPPTFLF